MRTRCSIGSRAKRDMAIFALAREMRNSNVADLEWRRIDLERHCCIILGPESTGGGPIPVLVLERWQELHAAKGAAWSRQVQLYVFAYRNRAERERVGEGTGMSRERDVEDGVHGAIPEVDP